MTTIAVQLSSGVYGPVTPIPAGSIGVTVAPSSYTVAAPDDFFSPAPPSVNNAITNVFSGAKTIGQDYFGLTFHRYPGGTTLAPKPAFAWARSHDYAPGSARVRWNKIEQVQGVYDWSALDLFVETHKAAGRKIIHTLFGSPSWASARPAEACSYENGAAAEPANLAHWDAYCAACASRYKGKIDYYEVWNEPNLTGFYTGTQTLLAQMTRRASQTIKAIDPAAKIISPAVTSLQSGNGQAYFSAMMAASDGAASNMAAWTDVVGVHLYPNNIAGVASLPTMLSTFMASLSGLGLSGKQVVNTEFGMLSPKMQQFSKADRSNILARLMLLAAVCSGGCSASIWYDGDTDSDIGMTRDDWDSWNAWRLVFLSGPVTLVNVLKDGRVAATINSTNYLM